ncbi:hypothetical protein [Embleya sp. NPDC059237]|uniref:hypothetical protein n=1 Tax=Embleya sp. NPDC059237 TaxID=3346784 RepID=UPI0036A270A2
MTGVLILAAVYGLGVCGHVALLLHLTRTDPWIGTLAQVNPRAVALAGAVTAVAWPAVWIAEALIRCARPRP